MKIRFPHHGRIAAFLLSGLFAAYQPVRADLAITEIMAVADLSFPDEDGAPSDWVEITNTGVGVESLVGHFLTNDADNLTRWAFPNVSIPAGQSIVVFASGKDRAVAGSELHTNFTLDRGGDYLGLIGPGGAAVVSELAPSYPEQYDGVSYGVGTAGASSAETFVERSSTVRYHIPLDDSLGDTWQTPAFDDAGWAVAPGAVGFESGTPPSGLWAIITTNISGDMKGVNASGYFRFPFTFDGATSDVTALQLKVWCDDGFVAYLNGTEIEADRMPASPTFSSGATGGRGDGNVLAGPLEFDLSDFGGLVVDGANVLSFQAANTSAGGSDFMIDAELSGEVVDTSGGLTLGFFEEPTPGSPNATNKATPPAVVEFTEASGVFTNNVVVELSCATPGAMIRYTTDLSVPTNELGATSIEYTGPITATTSTQIRARSFLTGSLDGPVKTETFLKIDANVAAFSSNLPIIVQSTLGGGAPFDSGSTTRRPGVMMMFEPDPQTGRASFNDPPTVATRMGVRKRGSSSAGWPKYGMSVEMWNDDGRDFDGNGQIAVDEEVDNNVEMLDLGDEADWILSARWRFDLSLMRNPFIYEMSRQIGRYATESRFVELFNDVDTGAASDQVDDDPGNRSSRDYFGVYSLMQRIEIDSNRVDIEGLKPWENDEPEVTGGYVWKKDRSDPGEAGFSAGGMGSLVHVDPDGSQVSAAQKTYIGQHLAAVDVALSNPSGVNPATGIHYEDYIDSDSWIDHIMLNGLAMNVDWGRLSAYLHKDRGGKVIAGPIWDFDRNMGSEDGRDDSPLRWDGTGDSSRTFYDNRYAYFGKLLGFQSQLSAAQLANPAAFTTRPDVFQRFIDRWFEVREGPMATTNMHAVIDGMAAEIAEGAARNFVRWPENLNANDNTYSTPPRSGGWEGEVSQLKGWMAARGDWIDSQFLQRPTFSHPGGLVADGFELTMFSPDGGIYYTLDGTDPRAPGGAPSVDAIQFEGGPVDSTFLGQGTAFTYHIPTDDSLGATWRQPAFDDTGWSAGVGGAGWESAGGTLEPFIETNIEGDMRGTNSTGYFRYEFEFDNGSNVNSMSLTMLMDDGFVAYLNGVQVASLLAPGPLLFDSQATSSRSDGTVIQGLEIDLTGDADLLVDGTNVLAIHALARGTSGSDFLVRPELLINHNVSASAITLSGAAVVTARTLADGIWSAPSQAGYVAGATPADATNLVVSEMNYRPADASAAEITEGYSNRDLFEYVELMNVGADPVTLVGVQFTAGVDFNFDTGSITMLMPGDRALVVRDAAAFEFRYGAAAAARVAGTFANDTGLSNGGEQIALMGVSGVIQDFTYDDSDPWPTGADGDGFSLELIAPTTLPDHTVAANWRSSAAIGGTPGTGSGVDFDTWAAANGNVAAGDDGDNDGRDALLEFAQGSNPGAPEPAGDYLSTRVETLEVGGVESEYLTIRVRKNLEAVGISFVPEKSTDIEIWVDAGPDVVLVEEDNLGDGTARVKFRTSLPIDQLMDTELFLRIRIDQN